MNILVCFGWIFHKESQVVVLKASWGLEDMPRTYHQTSYAVAIDLGEFLSSLIIISSIKYSKVPGPIKKCLSLLSCKAGYHMSQDAGQLPWDVFVTIGNKNQP